MSILRRLENTLSDLVEGSFSRVFKSEVRPVELARKLAREMEEHKTQTLSRTYAPNEYRVFLSPQDRDRFAETEQSLSAELSGYLLEHARRERLVLASRPIIHFETDRRLRLGEFGIQTSLVEHRDADFNDPEPAAAPIPVRGDYVPEPIVPASGRTMVHSTAERVAERLADARPPQRRSAVLQLGGKRLIVGEGTTTLGRSRTSDVMVDDANVSRAHAEIRAHGSSWVLADLGSTNGTRLNGRRLTQPEVLKSGDEIEVGTTKLTFALE